MVEMFSCLINQEWWNGNLKYAMRYRFITGKLLPNLFLWVKNKIKILGFIFLGLHNLVHLATCWLHHHFRKNEEIRPLNPCRAVYLSLWGLIAASSPKSLLLWQKPYYFSDTLVTFFIGNLWSVEARIK